MERRKAGVLRETKGVATLLRGWASSDPDEVGSGGIEGKAGLQ